MTSPMTPHLEKIARAIYADRWDGGDIDQATDFFADEARQAARAALSALLPPSEEMVQAIYNERVRRGGPLYGSASENAAIFTAAIQSILAEGEGA